MKTTRRFVLACGLMDLSPLLHAALRKACDSDIAGIAYNLIHIKDGTVNAVWEKWLGFIYIQLMGRTLTTEDLFEICQDSLDSLPTTPTGKLFHRIFESFDSQDWRNMFSYVIEEKGAKA